MEEKCCDIDANFAHNMANPMNEPATKTSPQNAPQNLPGLPNNIARESCEECDRLASHVCSAHTKNATESALSTKTEKPVYNWQATMKSVTERFKFLFNNETLSDVHFLIGKGDNQQTIPAHKFILCCGSAVFDALFNGNLATQSDLVELPDVEPPAFLALLKFLYYDALDVDSENVMTILYTAKKYAVPALESHCVDFLQENLRSDNAFMLFTQARLFDEPQLASICLDRIDKNTAEALAAEGFTDIDLDSLCLVLERNTLAINEGKLFQAVLRWAEAECRRKHLQPSAENQRAVLGRALYLIRFPLMSTEEFAVIAVQSGLLTDNEAVKMFLYFMVNPKPPCPFVDRLRYCMTGREATLRRFKSTESRWGYSGSSDRIRFTVNRRICIVALGLYGSIHMPSEYSFSLQIVHYSGRVCGSTTGKFTSNGNKLPVRVQFREPVEVEANKFYVAAVVLTGPDSYYGTKGMRKVTVEVPESGEVIFNFSYAAGDNNGTSIEDGQIPEIIFHV